MKPDLSGITDTIFELGEVVIDGFTGKLTHIIRVERDGDDWDERPYLLYYLADLPADVDIDPQAARLYTEIIRPNDAANHEASGGMWFPVNGTLLPA